MFISSIIAIDLINNEEQIIPKKLIHGVPHNDTWKVEVFYEYYIDISNYELNEDNIFEIYSKNTNIDSIDIKLYLLLTDAKDETLIKSGTIKPNTKKDEYIIKSLNIRFDNVLNKTYFFLPFKKTASSQNYFIILVQNDFRKELQIFCYVSERIRSINISQINPDKVELYEKEIETRNDTRLYYKIDISKINLIKNNFIFFIDEEYNKDIKLEVKYYYDFSSLDEHNYYNIFILEKNTTNISEVFFGIKSKKNNNHIILSIRIDDNAYYYISDSERLETKLYVENMKCNKDVFIIEDYKSCNINGEYILTLDDLYGAFNLKMYGSIRNLDFENYPEEEGDEISDMIKILNNSLFFIYILKCKTPTAFNFEIFLPLNLPSRLKLGQKIKTDILESDDYYKDIHIDNSNYFDQYKINVKIMDYYPYENRSLFILFQEQGQYKEVMINEPNEEEHTEIIYAYNQGKTFFRLLALYDFYIEYYFTSNGLYTNIEEGRTVIDRLIPNAAFKIRKNGIFDYISFKAHCEDNIEGKYELQLINIKDMEHETNIVMVGLPNINMPYSKDIYLRFSNPYNKFDQMVDINSDDNYYYLLLSFQIGLSPIYIDIEYYLNEEIIILPPAKSKIISPMKEYKVYATDFPENKDQILFNIHKCNNQANYTLYNYFENSDNIIKEIQIVESHQIILLDNIYIVSKLTLYNSSELNNTTDKKLLPAAYYNKGDILLNYFNIQSSLYKELKFTSNYSITYEEESWNEIIFSWNEYIHRLNNDKKMNIRTNYSIYILPNYSIVNTICQLHLIPSNKSIVDVTKIKIELNEGNYKVMIIANVIDKDMPFETMYDILELNVIKKLNIVLIVLCCIFGFIAILGILMLIFRKKIKSFIKKRRLKKHIKELNDDDNKDYSIENEEEEEEDNKTRKLSERLVKIFNWE